MPGQPTLKEKNLTVLGIFKESWQLVYGLKLPVFLLCIIIVIALIAQISIYFHEIILPKMSQQFAIAMATAMSQKGMTPPPIPQVNISISSYIFVIVTCLALGAICSFCTSMLIMLGVRQAIGLPVKIRQVFKECKKVLPDILLIFLIIVMLAATMIILKLILGKVAFIGTLVYLLCHITIYYVGLALCVFALPLIVIKHTPIDKAIKDSMQKMNANWRIIIPLYILISIVANISALFFGLGLIWTIPMIYAAGGICFREVYGLKKTGSKEKTPPHIDTNNETDTDLPDELSPSQEPDTT